VTASGSIITSLHQYGTHCNHLVTVIMLLKAAQYAYCIPGDRISAFIHMSIV
jgi:hypothetical protein